MFVKVHAPKSVPAGSNKGSAKGLINYLEKENKDKENGDREYFFSHKANLVEAKVAVESLDKNNKGIGKNDSKFFMVTINPSQSEQAYMLRGISGMGVEDVHELTPGQKEEFKVALRDYTRDVMDIYAQNFGRENVRDGNDLVYFAKIEESRTYKHYDRFVKENNAIGHRIIGARVELEEHRQNNSQEGVDRALSEIRQLESQYHRVEGKVITSGMTKPGLNFHVHVVVSRNNQGQTTKLSPFSKSRGGFQKLNGGRVGQQYKQGFDHEAFKVKAGEKFNERTGYTSTFNDSYKPKAYARGREQHTTLESAPGTNALVNQVKGQVVGNDFRDERKVLNTVKTAASLLNNPTQTIASKLKGKIKQILQADNVLSK